MAYAVIAERARRGAAWLFPLLGFAIPISTALDSTVLALIVLAWLVALPHAYPAWRRTFAVRSVAVAAALFALLAIATLYSDAPANEAWKIAMKYADLFLISVLLWTAAALRRTHIALYAFLFALVLNLVVSYTVSNSLIDRIPGLHTYPAYPVGFKLSVTHNIFISFGAFVFLLLAREAKTTATRAPLIGLAIICAHNVLVIVIGRTGYLVLALLSAYFILVSLRTWQSRALALAFVVAFFGGAYSVSGSFQERVASIVSDLEQWRPGAADRTSVGQRIEYVRTSARIIAEHPLTGVGTGGFAAAYRGATESTLVTTNPHNDYAMIGVQVGLPGIALLLALYALLWRDAGRLASRLDRDLLRGIVLTMATAGFFNSVMLDHAEGLLLAWMVALIYARNAAARTA